MTTPPQAFHHPSLGFSLELPPGTEVLDGFPAAALVAAEPFDPAAAFRANLVVTVEELVGADSVGAYTDASLAVQAAALVDFRLIDREPVTVGEDEGTRTLAHHDVDGQAVVLEQWRLIAGNRGYTLTASCWTLDYDVLADVFATSAETFAA